MNQTLCPSCGHSPIPDGAETCPKCGEPFAFLATHKKRDLVENETTTLGGALTGEVTAHPGAAAAVFALGAVLWFLRAGGVIADYGEPVWTYALVLVDLVLATVLMVNLGPAKLLAQIAALLQLGVAAFLANGRFDNPRHLFFCAHAVVLLVLVVGEPSSLRRRAGLAVAVLMAVGALGVMTTGLGEAAKTGGMVEIAGHEGGYRLLVPEGYRLLSSDELTPHLRPPLDTATAKSAGFGNKVRRVYGAVTLDSSPGSQLIGGCQEHLRALGGVGDPVPVAGTAPVGLGSGALLYALRTDSGASGRLGCGKLPDGRFVALAVVALESEPTAAQVFEQVGAALSFK
jgi:ribosomal protein S27AE